MTSAAVDMRMVRASGIGTILVHVVPFLVAHRPQWRFRLLGDPAILRHYPWASAANVEIVPFGKPIYSIAEQVAFPRRALAGTDILWSPNYNIPHRWRGPLLVNVNDVAHLALPDTFGGFAKQTYARAMFAAVRRRADGIVFISDFSQREFGERVGQPRGLSRMIHCGVDESWFGVQPGVALRPRPFILFVGNVKPHKNLLGLLEAFGRVQNRIPHDLVIVGKKEGFITGVPRVHELVSSFGGRVDFTGYVPDDELRRFFAQADALVLPSFYEGFGLPPVEAMAVGCPALVSDVASLPEVCGDAALYCNPHDAESIAVAMYRIVTDEMLRATLRPKGYARARALSWTVAGDGYLKMFEAVLAKNGMA
jgi:glycosyltransferase involved in cell wall biosynthesis